jgi:hypothetical protein
MADPAEGPVRLTDDGETVQFTPAYPVRHDRLTVPLNPFRGVRVIVEAPDCPGAEMLIEVGFADMV